VPNDLKIRGWRDTFTIEVTFDTRDLYGTVTGKRKITIGRD
jgi:hypothetical protein